MRASETEVVFSVIPPHKSRQVLPPQVAVALRDKSKVKDRTKNKSERVKPKAEGRKERRHIQLTHPPSLRQII